MLSTKCLRLEDNTYMCCVFNNDSLMAQFIERDANKIAETMLLLLQMCDQILDKKQKL